MVFWSGFHGGGDILSKMSDTDLELLARYTRQHAEDAFAELVRRHLDLVFSAALRQVRSPQLAEEVAQSTFTDLARQAHRLAPDTILTAWLYRVTRRTAIDVVRREARRQHREQVACELNAMNTAAADWTHIEPLLDEAMHALKESDRAAVLLRYFENKSLREVGQTLGTNEDAARKRVIRAVERLRDFFAKRGVTIGASGLIVIISANAVQAAPAGLAVTISAAAAFAGTTIAATTTATAIKTIAMTTLQKTLVTATLAAAIGTGIYEARQASNLRTQVQTLQQQQAALTDQIQQLQSERDNATNWLASLADQNATLKRSPTELLKLRGEVARLRADSNDPTDIAPKALLAKVNKLKQRLQETPDAKIPELQFLTEQDWLNAANGRLDRDTDYRRALSKLRFAGEGDFAGMLNRAVKGYMQSNNAQMPTDLTKLQPYFDSPVDDAILRRWEIVPANTIPGLRGEGLLITQKEPVDEIFDTRFGISSTGLRSVAFLTSEIGSTLGPVYDAYKAANNGTSPTDVSKLMPYAKTPEQQAAVEKSMLWDSSLK